MIANLKIEPKIGEVIIREGIKYITQVASERGCGKCAFLDKYCADIVCSYHKRRDGTSVIFKKVETNMNEVKIQIPDNCELIKDGDTYIVREKKQEPPRSWEDFCERHPIQLGEAKLDSACNMYEFKKSIIRRPHADRNVYTSEQEAEAFLALMQLRQLRKAWIKDEKEFEKPFCIICRHDMFNKPISVVRWNTSHRLLSFPSEQMAKNFLNCFVDLCETAKILL